MPRKPRADYRGALHHVILRGVERRAIFMDDADRARFLFRLEGALLPAGTACHAWALMPNHVHMVLGTGHRPLCVSMHRLGATYAMDFNRRYDRVGHLFQDRYRAIPLDGDAHLQEAIRYIHLNPLRAGIVANLEALETYPWTGHRVLMGRGGNRFQSVEGVLALMANDPSEARTRLREWMAGALLRDPEEATGRAEVPASPVSDDPVAQDPLHCAGTDRARPGGDTPRWVRANLLRQEGWDLPRLTRHVGGLMEVPVEGLLAGRRSRPLARARAVIAWFAWRDLGLSQPMVGRYLGVGPSALSSRMELGRNAARELGIDPFRSVLRPPSPMEELRRGPGSEK